MKTTSNTILKSLFWKAGEKGVVQLTRLIMEIILARLLLPSDFGVFALILTFVSISTIIIEGGLGTALIQTEELKEEDASTVLYILLIFSLLFYIIIFASAHKIADFYKSSGFELYLRVVALSLFPTAYNSVQNSLAMRQFKFRLLFKVNSIAIIVSGAVAIVLAYLSFGIWALIVQYFIQIFLACFLMHFMLKWRPISVFSSARGKKLISFGWKLMLANLLNRGYGEIYNLVIGKAFNTTTLGFYSRGKMLPGAFENGLTSVVTTVMLPVFSQKQNDVESLKRYCRLCIRMVTFVIAPIFCGIAATSVPIVEILLTHKWIDTAPIMEILCFGFIFQPISHINTAAINGLGRSDIVLKLEIIKRSIGILLLLISINFGIQEVAIALSISYFINMILNYKANTKLINFTFIELFKDVSPSILIALIMYTLVKLVARVINSSNYFVILFIQILIGVIVYFALSLMCNRKVVVFYINKTKQLLKHNK